MSRTRWRYGDTLSQLGIINELTNHGTWWIFCCRLILLLILGNQSQSFMELSQDLPSCLLLLLLRIFTFTAIHFIHLPELFQSENRTQLDRKISIFLWFHFRNGKYFKILNFAWSSLDLQSLFTFCNWKLEKQKSNHLLPLCHSTPTETVSIKSQLFGRLLDIEDLRMDSQVSRNFIDFHVNEWLICFDLFFFLAADFGGTFDRSGW